MKCSECGKEFNREEEEDLCWSCTKNGYDEEGIRYLD